MATPSAIVERLFAETDDDDGEFVHPTLDVPYVIRGPVADPKCARIFITKPWVAAALDQAGISDRIATVRRAGLPSQGDLPLLKQLCRPGRLWFLGDMDPPDLLIFAWLRDRLPPAAVRHLGVNDALVERTGMIIRDASTIACSPREQSALAMLGEALPDLDDIVGPKCFELLRRGRKLELEALISLQPGRLAEILLQLPRA